MQHRQTAIRGIETYFLNFAMNDEAEAVALAKRDVGPRHGNAAGNREGHFLNNKLTESRSC